MTIALTVAGCPLRHSFEEQVGKAVGAVEGVTSVRLGFDVMSPQEKAALVSRLQGGATGKERTISLSPTTRVLAVASGKGGVGKSTLTANLAYALSTLGEEVGVLDGDVYGHSIPHMLGIHQKPIAVDEMMVPPVRGDLKLMSIGFFLEENAPIMWRGPMLHKALEQFLSDVHWGDLDTLLVDMPPGTGDVAMSLGQLLPRAEALIVTTPQPAAQQVAVRAAQMALKTGMRIVGAVENMSYLVGTGQELFGSGGGQALADEIGTTLLARIPLDPVLREAADDGTPVLEVAPGLRGRAGDPRAGEVGRRVAGRDDSQAAHRSLAPWTRRKPARVSRRSGWTTTPSPCSSPTSRMRSGEGRRATASRGSPGSSRFDIDPRARPSRVVARGRIRALGRRRRARVSRPRGDRAGDRFRGRPRARGSSSPSAASRVACSATGRGGSPRAGSWRALTATSPRRLPHPGGRAPTDGNQPARDRRFPRATADRSSRTCPWAR